MAFAISVPVQIQIQIPVPTPMPKFQCRGLQILVYSKVQKNKNLAYLTLLNHE